MLVEQKAMTVAEFKLTAEEEGQRLGGVSRGPHGAAAQQAQAGGGLAAGRTTRSTSSCHSRPPPVVDVHWAAAKVGGGGDGLWDAGGWGCGWGSERKGAGRGAGPWGWGLAAWVEFGVGGREELRLRGVKKGLGGLLQR